MTHSDPDPSDFDVVPLGYPSDAANLVEIPAAWTVWAFGDVHGVLSGLREVLERSGLIGSTGDWTGGREIALVGVGDYIDRGADSRGVIEFLRVLDRQMAAAGSRLVLVRGNHEQMLADILRWSGEWYDTWAVNGGNQFAQSYGLRSAARPLPGLRDTLLELDPQLLDWLLSTLPYARWRDVIFVHAGLPKGSDPASLLNYDGQLWEGGQFIGGAGVLIEPELAPYRDAGVARIVVGHVPQSAGPSVEHEGALLCLDTMQTDGTGGWITAARLPEFGSLDGSKFVLADVSKAPDRIRRW
jgi:hypothetical protein